MSNVLFAQNSSEKWLERLKQRRDFEEMQIRDPQTGKIPLQDATAVKEQLYQQQSAAKQEEAQAVGNEKWIALGPTEVGCRIRSLLLISGTYQKAFAGTVGGGLWRCDNIKAATPIWKPVCGAFDNLAVTALAVQPTNNGVLYMGTGEGWYNPGILGFDPAITRIEARA